MALIDFIDQIKKWPLSKKLSLVAVIALSMALMAGIMLWSQRVDYQVLYSNLSQEDAGQAVTKLKEMKVPYSVEGNAIYVPSSKVYELRLELASLGIPQGGGVGFEIFDKNQIGITEFVQRLNYVRAIQGELTRTIKQLAEVDQARVHIAVPEKTIFSDREEKPTASIVLKLKAGRTLNPGQIGGIVHLVSSSVEGLTTENVTIIDNMGNLLSKASDFNAAVISDSKHLDYQKSVDKEYESRLQTMLEGIAGRGKAIVRVATKIDFSQVEKTEEKFDPDSIAIRSEQRTQEKSSGATPGGIPGVVSNQPGQPQTQASGGGSSSQRSTENINYEVSRTVSKIIQPRGEVKGISVAVLVDGTYKQDKGKKTYSPRSEDDLKKYREIVMAAIGYNKDRGDQVIVENVPFEPGYEDIPEKTDYIKIVMSLLKYIAPLIAIAMLIFFVIKPLITTLKTAASRKAEESQMAPMFAAAKETAPETSPEEIMKEDVLDIVKKDPKKASMILKEWLAE